MLLRLTLITKSEIENIIASSERKTSSGYDEVSAKLFKKTYNEKKR